MTILGPASDEDDDPPTGVVVAPPLVIPVPLLPPVAAAAVEPEEALQPRKAIVLMSDNANWLVRNRGEDAKVTDLPLSCYASSAYS